MKEDELWKEIPCEPEVEYTWETYLNSQEIKPKTMCHPTSQTWDVTCEKGERYIVLYVNNNCGDMEWQHYKLA